MRISQNAGLMALALALVPGCAHRPRAATELPSVPVIPNPVTTADVESRHRAAAWLMEEATDSGDVGAIRRALASGADLEQPGESGYTPLQALAANGHVSGIRLVLRRGAQINGRTLGEVTPLMVAATHGRLAVVRELLRQGAKLDLRDGKRRTALHHAAFSGHAEIAEALIKSGAQIDAKDAQDHSPLSIALGFEESRNGGPRFCRIIRILLRYGAKEEDVRPLVGDDDRRTRARVRAALRRCREADKPGASERRARAYADATAKLAAEVDPRKFYEKEMNRVIEPEKPLWKRY